MNNIYIYPQECMSKQAIDLASSTITVTAPDRITAALLLEDYFLNQGFISQVKPASLIQVHTDIPHVGAYS